MIRKNNFSSKKTTYLANNEKKFNNNSSIEENSKSIKKPNKLFLYLYNFFISFFESNKDKDKALVEKFYGIKKKGEKKKKVEDNKLSIKEVGIFSYLRNSFISFFKPSDKKFKIYFRF